MQRTQPQRHSLSIAILVGLMGFSGIDGFQQPASTGTRRGEDRG